LAKVYVNQALSLALTYLDQDGVPIDITAGTVTAALYSPSNRTTTADATVSGNVVSGAAGTATANIAKDTLDEPGQWRCQPLVSLSGTVWPGEVFAIEVTNLGSLN